MNKSWLYAILVIAFCLLTLIKALEKRSMSTIYISEKVIKLSHFEKAKSQVEKKDLELLKLWESMLTGRSAPLSKWMKERYKFLALNHIFTPSGFHLSAILFPFMKFIPKTQHLYLLIVLGFSLIFISGFGALKRMVLIKGNQNLFGLHLGFILALLLDIFFGTFQTSPLSFTYSFLFLGIIYGGAEGIQLILWFFIGQALISLFQNQDLSLLILIFSPLLNFLFALIMPLLLLLSYPLWNWQLSFGLILLRIAQWFVDLFANISLYLPTIEIHFVTLIIFFLFLTKKRNPALIGCFFFCSSLNLDLARFPNLSKNEFVPQGEIIRVTAERIYFEDGICRVKLVRGIWWENCSPKRRSSRKILL